MDRRIAYLKNVIAERPERSVKMDQLVVGLKLVSKSCIGLLMLLSGILIFLVPSVACQEKQEEQERVRAQESAKLLFLRWESRVSDLTKGIVSDAGGLGGSERALYTALLAKIWWKTDEAEGRVHLMNSEKFVRSFIDGGMKDGSPKDLLTTLQPIEIISSLDEKLAQKLIVRLEEAADELKSSDGKNDRQMAEFFVALGLEIAKSDPKLALESGQRSLAYGFAMNLPALVVELNLRDGNLAESLTKLALLRSSQSYTAASYLLMFNLDRYMSEFNKGKPFSEGVRRSVVRVFAEMLSNAAIIEYERSARCGIVTYAPSFLPRVDEYFPDISVTFRQSLQTCLPFSGATFAEKTKFAERIGKLSAEELVQAAAETSDEELKLALFRAAFTKLKSEKRFDRIVSILDGLDGDDFKKVSPIGWDDWRVDASFNGAFEAFEAGDLPATYRYIEGTPTRIRHDVRSQLVSKAAVAKNKEFYVENLDAMQKELGSLEIPAPEAAQMYLRLAHLYIKVRNTETELMFRTAAKYINKADSENSEVAFDKEWAPMSRYVTVSSELVEIDEIGINAALKSVSSPKSRLKLRMGLLESSLKAFLEAKLALQETRPPSGTPSKRRTN